ncbi:hypothetical protein BGW38_002923, partial [Lunasporangiospora selenospora]
RASDGGSILSTAAAAVTSTLVSRMPFHLHHQQSSSSSSSSSSSTTAASVPGHYPNHVSSAVFPNSTTLLTSKELSQPSTQKKGGVKVTLHQQQGANSTLKIIYSHLCSAWEILQQQQL